MFNMVFVDLKNIRGVRDFFLMFIGIVMVVFKRENIYDLSVKKERC